MASKGVIVEFDFTVVDGAELLFSTTSDFLKELDGISFDIPTEDRFMSGCYYLAGLTEFFQEVKTKKTAQKAARDLSAAFVAALNEAVPAAISPAFKNFVKALTDKGVKVVIATRADLEKVTPAFEPILSDNVVLYHESSTCYGSVKWDSWRRACAAHRMSGFSTIAVVGSGKSVKSALHAGMGAFAVVNDHVAYQDFSGADEVVDELSGVTAKKLLDVLRV